ncbi:hypothetical protein BaRGS_00009615 [Batillaria attramentaria]|uniref:Uncharacterized protein n=1 Tax=Batillaria attramentaria TaxID=370345 RepID=A0ABD0LIY6_9CAEN
MDGQEDAALGNMSVAAEELSSFSSTWCPRRDMKEILDESLKQLVKKMCTMLKSWPKQKAPSMFPAKVHVLPNRPWNPIFSAIGHRDIRESGRSRVSTALVSFYAQRAWNNEVAV